MQHLRPHPGPAESETVLARFPRDSHAHLNLRSSDQRHKSMPLKKLALGALLQIFKMHLRSGNGRGLLGPVGLFNTVGRFWVGWAGVVTRKKLHR